MTQENKVQDNSAKYYQLRYSGYGLKYHSYLISWLMSQAHGKILDAGCGTGIVSELYPKLDIMGIDLSDGMLVYHKGRHMKMDVTDINLPDNQFDFILCRSLLHHLPLPKLGLSEMKRVLKPNGRITFLETNQSAIASLVRKKTQHGDRFSSFHTSFKDYELIELIGDLFKIEQIRYFGYLAYPLFGFPDIINFERYIPLKSLFYPLIIAIDNILAKTPILNRMSWAIGLQGVKR